MEGSQERMGDLIMKLLAFSLQTGSGLERHCRVGGLKHCGAVLIIIRAEAKERISIPVTYS